MAFLKYLLMLVSIAILLAQVKLSPVAKRSFSRFWDEGLNNGGLPGANADEQWIGGGGSPGKRGLTARYWGNDNGGVPGAGDDESWLGGGSSPGKRWVAGLKARYWEDRINDGAPTDEELQGLPGKRWLAGRYWDEGNENGGIPGAGDDEEWLGGGANPGKRNLRYNNKPWTVGGLARYYDESNTNYTPLEMHSGGKREDINGDVEATKEPIKNILQKENGSVFKSLGDFFHRVHLVSGAHGK